MKSKRYVIAVILSCIVIICASYTCALAYNDTTTYDSTHRISVYGYIDFLEGPNIIRDKVWYHGNLSGDSALVNALYPNAEKGDKNCAYIQPGNNNGYMLTCQFMYGGRTRIQGPSNGAYCGYGGTKGKLIINAGGTIRTIYA